MSDSDSNVRVAIAPSCESVIPIDRNSEKWELEVFYCAVESFSSKLCSCLRTRDLGRITWLLLTIECTLAHAN